MRMLALDIGGTAVKYGVFYSYKPEFGQFPVRDENGIEDVPGNLCKFVCKMDPDFIAVSTPGPFDFEFGISHMKHKLPSLYNVSLKECLEKEAPKSKVYFIHDAAAFALGAMDEMPKLSRKRFASVMLGTGLGYVCSNCGEILLNSLGTPQNRLWSKPFLNGICEDYVSTNRILSDSQSLGYEYASVKEIAEAAKSGNMQLKKVFDDFGRNLGQCIHMARQEDKFECAVIGGQISLSWILMKDGFENVVSIPYELVNDPSKCALYGLRKYVLDRL